jgi:hypothetical protein
MAKRKKKASVIETPEKIIIKLPLGFKHKNFLLYKVLSEDSFIFQSKHLGKKIDTDFLVPIKHGLSTHTFFNAKKGTINTHLRMTRKELKTFLKYIEKRLKVLDAIGRENPRVKGTGLIHLNPELSIALRK